MANHLLEFTQALWHGGELVLSSKDSPLRPEITESVQFLNHIEVEYRKTLPDGVPPINPGAAKWALTSLFRASQFLVFRELSEELLRTEMASTCPEEKSAAVCYSVDLSFRFLPEMLRLTRAVSSQDPLLEFLKAWAIDWPLSSVGVSDVNPGPIDAIIEHPALRTMYVDRILATGDVSRLGDTRVMDAVRAALGGFRELSPAMYDLVFKEKP